MMAALDIRCAHYKSLTFALITLKMTMAQITCFGACSDALLLKERWVSIPYELWISLEYTLQDIYTC